MCVGISFGVYAGVGFIQINIFNVRIPLENIPRDDEPLVDIAFSTTRENYRAESESSNHAVS